MVHGDDIDDNLSVAWLLPSVSHSIPSISPGPA